TPGLVECVPALVNLMVVFDPLVTTHTALRAAVGDLVTESLRVSAGDQGAATTQHDIPVCFDADLAPDLPAVARACDMSEDAVITCLTATPITVAMYGFAPGYAYLTGLPPALHVPRKPAPVRDVPKGSLLIAGPQALITTLTMPTGWSILGRSRFQVMDPEGDPQFRMAVGDTVQFRRVPRAEFEAGARP
ncbi:MAG: carboxyltransferase domain-containing protein, partial [Planctomycetota bacterium]